MKKLKVLELFGGIGACTEAMKRIGIDFEVVDYVEINEHSCNSYNAINGTNFQPQDIKEWDKDIEVDFICHGSPCTNFSLAGKQEGGDEGSNTASSLMYETLRIVKKLMPKYVLWENVANLVSEKHFHNFANYLNRMADMGYANAWQILNSKDYGVAQNRERVFTISVLGGDTEDLFGEKLEFEFPKPIPLQKRLKDYLEENVDGKYYLSEKRLYEIAHWNAYQQPLRTVQGKNSIIPTLTARGAGEEHSGMIVFSPQLEDTTDLQEECLLIKTNNAKGYMKAFDGDGVNIGSRMRHQRGTVQPQQIHTLTTMGGENQGVVVKKED